MQPKIYAVAVAILTILLVGGFSSPVEAQSGASIDIVSASPSEGSSLSGGESASVTATVSWDTGGSTPDDIHIYINEDPYGEIDRQIDISQTSGSQSITVSDYIGSDWDQATLKVSLYEEDNFEALSTDSITYVVGGSGSSNEPPNLDLQCAPDDPTVDEDLTCVAGGVDADGTIEDYYWDFDGDSYFSAGDTQVHEFETSGRKTIEVEATDNDGATTTDTITVSVDDNTNPPTADIDCSPTTITAGERINCDASGSTDDNRITEYDWSFGDGSSGSGSSESHTYSTPGSYTVEATVTDADDLSDTVTTTVSVEDDRQPPTADLECSPTSISPGESISCDASGSTDDNQITGYEWDFGDGETGFGATESHTYSSPGTYTVEATITDADDLSDTVTTTVTVENGGSHPTVDIECSPTSIEPDESISCDASGSTDDKKITGYEWDFGDGETGFGATESHTYSSPGTYTIEATVTDVDELRQTDTTTVTVDERPSLTVGIDCSPAAIAVGESISCDASGSTDSRVSEYEWDFGDGEIGSGATESHTYSAPGTYTIEVTITGESGESKTETTTISVEEVPNPPTAEIECTPTTLTVDESISCDASDSTDDDRITEYSWDFDDGDENRGIFESHTYDSPGYYTIELTVSDSSDMTDTETVEINVVGTDNDDMSSGDDTSTDPEETEIDNGDSEDDASSEEDSVNSETPGFGIISALSGICGLGYILKRRLTAQE